MGIGATAVVTLAALAFASAAAETTPWYCSLHAGDIRHNLTLAAGALKAAKELGCAGVRTDVPWSELERSEG